MNVGGTVKKLVPHPYDKLDADVFYAGELPQVFAVDATAR